MLTPLWVECAGEGGVSKIVLGGVSRCFLTGCVVSESRLCVDMC